MNFDQSNRQALRRHGLRKNDHIRINLEEEVEVSGVSTGFDKIGLRHQALPELGLQDVDTSTTFLGRHLKMPLLISSMTGGTAEAQQVNRRLAESAQSRVIAMGVGSQRIMVEGRQPNADWKALRELAPDIPLLANIGIVQLNQGYGPSECQQAIDAIEADALFLHCNALQECIQPEGNVEWSGLLYKLEQVCKDLPVPVFIKEVGWGIDGNMARQLRSAGVAGIDVAGAGGTSWSEVERHRAENGRTEKVAMAFREWGMPTAYCLQSIRQEMMASQDSECLLIASGGIRSGVEVAKALVLGADLVGIAAPFLKQAVKSVEDVLEEIDTLQAVLQVAMFCMGIGSLKLLQGNSELLLESESPSG